MLSEQQNYRKVAESFCFFVKTPDKLEKFYCCMICQRCFRERRALFGPQKILPE